MICSADPVVSVTFTPAAGFDRQVPSQSAVAAPKRLRRVAAGAVTNRCNGILLGRTTYQMFEPAWSTRTMKDDPGAPFFNDTTKYVVSGTLTTATWRNSKIIGPYDPQAIRRLKDEEGDLYVSGSGTLVRAMLADGLVDELHLLVYPLTRGAGPRLFPENAAPGRLSLAACESYDHGVVYMNYRPQPPG